MLKSNGFEQHAEILCKLVKNGNKFFEVPVNYNGRTINEGKKLDFTIIFQLYIKWLKTDLVNWSCTNIMTQHR